MEKKYNNMNPLFFLFTCVKDGRDYIDRLFDSLLKQTKINFIHYIYEDGSTSPLAELVDNYIYKVSCLPYPYKVIYEKSDINIGLNMATKHCIDACQCEYFIWIDCDNWINNNFFKEMEKTAIRNKKSIVIRSNCYGLLQDLTFKSKINEAIAKKKNVFKYLLYGNYPYSFFAVNKKKFFQNNELIMVNDPLFFNDDQVLCNCFLICTRSSYSRKAISYFLIRDNSESMLGVRRKELNYDLLSFSKMTRFCKKEKYYFIDKMPVIRDLFFAMVSAISNLDKKTASVSLRNKRIISNKYHIPRRYRCVYGSDLWWLFLIYLIPFKKFLVSVKKKILIR